jgi:hypothetical protein
MMRLPQFLLFSFFAVLLVVNTSFGQKTRIAVCELSGQGVDQPTAVLVSERLAAWLAGMPAFDVTAPSRVYVLCKERGFAKSCKDDDSVCLSEMGRTIGADVVIAGIFAKAGNIYTILLRVVDAASGTILTTGYQDIDAPVDTILTTWTSKAAKQLETVITTKMSKFGALNIKSSPKGATVLLNGKEAGKTDCTIDRCFPGKNALELTLATYTTVRESVTVEPKKTISLSYQLKHTKAYDDSTKSKKITRVLLRTGLGCLSLACAGAGFFYNSRAAIAVEDERTAKTNYLNAGTGADFNGLYNQYQDAQKKTDDAIILRNILYGLSGACAVGFTISFFF